MIYRLRINFATMDQDFAKERRISTPDQRKVYLRFIRISTFTLPFSLSEIYPDLERVLPANSRSSRSKEDAGEQATFLGPAPKSEFPDIWQSLWPIQPATHHRSDKPPHRENRIDKNSRALSLHLSPFLFPFLPLTSLFPLSLSRGALSPWR